MVSAVPLSRDRETFTFGSSETCLISRSGTVIILVSPAQHLKYAKRDKPIRKTPTIEQFNQIIGSIRSQQFNGHNADDSADFPEFIGLAGLGQAEASALTWDDID